MIRHFELVEEIDVKWLKYCSEIGREDEKGDSSVPTGL